MECNKEGYRFFIETCRRNGIDPPNIHEMLQKAWPQTAPSLSTVYRLYNEFLSEARTSFDDAPRLGRPITQRTQENIQFVKDLVDALPHITIDEVVEWTDISHGTINTILREDLQLRNVCSRWIPYSLTSTQKENRVEAAQAILLMFRQQRHNILHRLVVADEKWFFLRTVGTARSTRVWIPQDGEPPRIPRLQQAEPKVMIILAVTFDGKFCFHMLPRHETVTADVYVDFLRRVHHNFSRHVTPLQWHETVFQHDNARVHTSHRVRSYFEGKHVQLLHQPPYSPDFNFLDRWWFSKLEAARRSINFGDENQLRVFLTDTLRSVSKDDLIYQFQKLKEDLQMVIDSHGDYL
jgi:hypothetical protein